MNDQAPDTAAAAYERGYVKGKERANERLFERGYAVGKVQAVAILAAALARELASDGAIAEATSATEIPDLGKAIEACCALEELEFTRASLLTWAGDLGLDVEPNLALQDVLDNVRSAVETAPAHELAERLRIIRDAAILPRNTRLVDKADLRGEWVAIPAEDFEALRKAVLA